MRMREPLDWFAVKPLDSTGAQRLAGLGYASAATINARVAALQAAAKNGSASAATQLSTMGYTAAMSPVTVNGRTTSLLALAAKGGAPQIAVLNYIDSNIAAANAPAAPVARASAPANPAKPLTVTLPGGAVSDVPAYKSGTPTYQQLQTGTVPWSAWMTSPGSSNAAVTQGPGASATAGGQDASFAGDDGVTVWPQLIGTIYSTATPTKLIAALARTDANGNASYIITDPFEANYYQSITNENGMATLGVPVYGAPGSEWAQFFTVVAIGAAFVGAAIIGGASAAGAAGAAADSAATTSAGFSAGIVDETVTAPALDSVASDVAVAPLDTLPSAPDVSLSTPISSTPVTTPGSVPLDSVPSSDPFPNAGTADPTAGIQQYVPPSVQSTPVSATNYDLATGNYGADATQAQWDAATNAALTPTTAAPSASSVLQTAGSAASAASSGAGLLSKVLGALGIGGAAAATTATGSSIPGAATMGANGGLLSYDDAPAFTTGGIIVAGGLVLMMIALMTREHREKTAKVEAAPAPKPVNHAPAHHAPKKRGPSGQGQMQQARAVQAQTAHKAPAKPKRKTK